VDTVADTEIDHIVADIVTVDRAVDTVAEVAEHIDPLVVHN
jgi:hypothetical protein